MRMKWLAVWVCAVAVSASGQVNGVFNKVTANGPVQVGGALPSTYLTFTNLTKPMPASWTFDYSTQISAVTSLLPLSNGQSIHSGYVVLSPSATLQDEWVTFTGCAFPNDGANLTCVNTETLPAAMPDTNYVVSCTEYTTPAVGAVILGNISYSITSTTGFSVEEMTQGSSNIWTGYPNYGKSYVCHAHHD